MSEHEEPACFLFWTSIQWAHAMEDLGVKSIEDMRHAVDVQHAYLRKHKHNPLGICRIRALDGQLIQPAPEYMKAAHRFFSEMQWNHMFRLHEVPDPEGQIAAEYRVVAPGGDDYKFIKWAGVLTVFVMIGAIIAVGYLIYNLATNLCQHVDCTKVFTWQAPGLGQEKTPHRMNTGLKSTYEVTYCKDSAGVEFGQILGKVTKSNTRRSRQNHSPNTSPIRQPWLRTTASLFDAVTVDPGYGRRLEIPANQNATETQRRAMSPPDNSGTILWASYPDWHRGMQGKSMMSPAWFGRVWYSYPVMIPLSLL